MLAYFVLSRPVFNSDYATEMMGKSQDPTKLMEDYSRNSGYLVSLSQAVGRLLLAGRDLTRFAGYAHRVSEFFNVLHDLNGGKYIRTMVSKEGEEKNEATVVDEKHLNGKVVERNGVIDFEQVPIATPNGDILVRDMTFKVETGMNCLITGPNGCGKSSLFRILGGLWPVFGGKLIKPTPDNMFYVPQKPYMPLGSLRDQVIYPHSTKMATDRGYTDSKIFELLETVRLEYLVEREGGWNTVRDWADVLSGGEKQRIAMARLFYHCPQFAILDECTSAVSIDVEGRMYEYARASGITLFTVSHRPSLFKYHEFLLKFDGHGSYEFSAFDHEKEKPVPEVTVTVTEDESDLSDE